VKPKTHQKEKREKELESMDTEQRKKEKKKKKKMKMNLVRDNNHQTERKPGKTKSVLKEEEDDDDDEGVRALCCYLSFCSLGRRR